MAGRAEDEPHRERASDELHLGRISQLPVVLQDGTNTYVYRLDLISATDGGGVQTYIAEWRR